VIALCIFAALNTGLVQAVSFQNALCGAEAQTMLPVLGLLDVGITFRLALWPLM
jgi:hypothetical protein